jgi:hypothetical protein
MPKFRTLRALTHFTFKRLYGVLYNTKYTHFIRSGVTGVSCEIYVTLGYVDKFNFTFLLTNKKSDILALALHSTITEEV